jgi:hypothetical protein
MGRRGRNDMNTDIDDIEIEYIRLRPTDSADLVFSSEKDRDRVRKHPR